MPSDDQWNDHEKKWEKRAYNATKSPGAIAWTIFKISMILLALGTAIGFFTGIIGTGTGVIKEVANPKNIIYNYEQFKRDAANVEVFNTNYETNKNAYEMLKKDLGDDRSKWAREDRAQLNTYQTAMVGNKAERNRLAAEYNAKSKMLSRKFFKGDDLPYSFSMIP